MTKAELLLHPVRMRIVKAFAGDRALTTTQLAAELDDLPAGSLYRHVALLTQAGILKVIDERRVRGAVERTYALRLDAGHFKPDEAATMTPDEHAQLFMSFIAGLIVDFDRCLAAGTPVFAPDGATYSASAVWLSDDEYADFLQDVRALMQSRLANGPGEGRRRRMIYSAFLPAPETLRGDDES